MLIVGLGNPGKKYEKTRHNVGFRVVDVLAEKEKWNKSKNANYFYIKKQIKNKDVELIKPLTFMNDSGKSVRYAQKKHHIPAEKIIVIHDDIDLPLGKIKISKSRGSAGHKGIESIIREIKTNNFIRIRIGIQPKRGKPKNVDKFVLGNFNREEEKILKEIISKGLQILKIIIIKGKEKAMNEFYRLNSRK